MRWCRSSLRGGNTCFHYGNVLSNSQFCFLFSKYPIAAALRLAAFLEEQSRTDYTRGEEYQANAEVYVEVALKLLNEIDSDHLATIVLV